MRVVIIAQKIDHQYVGEYPELEFKSINGPITSSLFFWLLFPFWYLKTANVINSLKKQKSISILCSVFPANWVGLTYKVLHRDVRCTWFCHEPSAFIHIESWRNAITSPIKRTIANLMAPALAVVDKKLVTFADELFVNSEYSKKIVRDFYKRDGIVIYPGVNSDISEPILFENKENRILTVGRLSKFKNIDIAINAFSKIEKKETSLYVIGDGEEKSNLINLTKKLGVSEKVKFFTDISDKEIAEHYAKAKLFILASKNEPFGLVSIEAMANGTPVIADASGGPNETILDNKTGRVIDCTIENLKMTIDELLKDEEKLKQYSIDAALHIKNNFSWEAAAEKIKKEI